MSLVEITVTKWKITARNCSSCHFKISDERISLVMIIIVTMTMTSTTTDLNTDPIFNPMSDPMTSIITNL